MLLRVTIAFLFISTSLWGQAEKEFEGVIRYRHYFDFTGFPGDTNEVKNALGTSSEFFYKEGNYKWVVYAETRIVEYFDKATQTVFSFYGKEDTLRMSEKNGQNDSLESLTFSKETYSVTGFLCKKAETVSSRKDDADFTTKRVLYYSDSVALAPGRFSGYRSYGSNVVFEKIKNWPLKIELYTKQLPFTLIIEAIEVNHKPVNDKDVLMPPGKPIKPLEF